MEKEEDPIYVEKRVIYQAAETSLLVVGAFIFYDIIIYFRPNLLKLLDNNKKLFNILKVILHVIFIFLLDLFLRYLFAFPFQTPL